MKVQLKMFEDEVSYAKKEFKKYVAFHKAIASILWKNKNLQRLELSLRIDNYFKKNCYL